MNLNRDIDTLSSAKEPSSLVIPYAFFNENTGLAVAGVVATSGYIQPQMATLTNVFVGSNGSTNLYLATLDTQIPWVERLFIDSQWMISDWEEIDSYQSGNPKFLNEEAGGNDSDKDNFVEAEGTDKHYRLKFKYLIPIGDGAKSIIHTFATDDGVLVEGYEAGGENWNPIDTGRSTVSLELFYRQQDIEDEFGMEVDGTASGIKMTVEYDNTDWYKNPSYGSRQRFSVSRDWGASSGSTTWTSIEFEYSKFIPLSFDKSTSRQRVLAFNFWISDVPTWDSFHTDSETGEEIFHRAPSFDGSTLGGLERQRGFSSNRFHDRSAINYALEYRHAPVRNPFKNLPLVNKLNISWWEWVVFAEVGRVASKWDFGDLHKKMKSTIGVGLRLNVFGLVIRADGAVSEEGGSLQMFFGHTF